MSARIPVKMIMDGTANISGTGIITLDSGSMIRIVDVPSTSTDIVNKFYVDSIAAGLDPKQSVKIATTNDIGGVYNSTGGSGNTGEFINVDLTNATAFDGLVNSSNTPIVLSINDRILIKDQNVLTQNGIYVVTTSGNNGVIERATDQDGSPNSEVSSGNYTFVEGGVIQKGYGYVLLGDGILTLNVDDIVWSQFYAISSVSIDAGNAPNQILIWNNNDAKWEHSTNLTITDSTNTINSTGALNLNSSSGTYSLTSNLGKAVLLVNGTNANLALVPNGTGSVLIGGNNTIMSDGNNSLSLISTSGNIILNSNSNIYTFNSNSGTSANIQATSQLILSSTINSVIIDSANDILIIGGNNQQGVVQLGELDFTGTAIEGMIKYNGTNFEGFNGSQWLRFNNTTVTHRRNRTTSLNTSSGTPVSIIADVFGTDVPDSNAIPLVFINGLHMYVSSGNLSGEVYFTSDSGSTAKTFSTLNGTEDLYFNPINAGFEISTLDTIEVRWQIIQ